MPGTNGKYYKLLKSLTPRRDLRASDKLLMAILTDRIGGNGACWPGLRSLARDTGLHIETVLESLTRLEHSGDIIIDRQGSGRTNRYILPAERSENPNGSARKIRTPKTGKRSENPNSGVRKTRTEALGKSEQNYTDPLNQTHKRSRSKQKPMYDKGSFDAFWTAYPRKVAKAAAQQAWQKIKPTPELCKTILAAVEQQKQTDQWRKDGGRFIPYPATWLNQERWTDEISGNGELTHDATEEEIAALERAGIL